jgi:glycosyltransferase involved in cell wall biosynthesis
VLGALGVVDEGGVRMKILGAMRVKNESRWLRRSIESQLPLVDRLLIMDDHSTDNTREIAASYPQVTVLPSPFDGLNEMRDKNWLLSQAMQHKPDWCLMLDGDEALEPGGTGKIRPALEASVSAYSLRIAYLWDCENQVRWDGVYGRFRRGSLFRALPGLQFQGTSNGGNFHCGSIPKGLLCRPLDVWVLHYGYMLREDRIRKYRWYSEKDPRNSGEDFYRHVVQGDLPEIPATARLKHAGPLELRPL